MKIFLRLRAGVAALALYAVPAGAQEVVPQATPAADALSEQMRVLAAQPRNVTALVTAGELATRLGDTAAALAFFGRAQAIEPTNPRIAAGKAGALVMMERPGEALALYAQAEAAGLSMTQYLSQRGLAYDLIGQTGYAQRDYRRALLTNRDDETVRRLALSLGISGRRDEAMELLDPLLRKSDRAAWRARACILAMGGDTAGAAKIATSMIPGGGALTGYFSRLQALSPADRAFAVHFGDVTPNVARSNDARLAPALAALPPEPGATPPVAIASAATDHTRERGRRAERASSNPTPSSVSSASVYPATRAPRSVETVDARNTRRTQPAPIASPAPSATAAPSPSWIADGRETAVQSVARKSPAASTGAPAPAPVPLAAPTEPARIESIAKNAGASAGVTVARPSPSPVLSAVPNPQPIALAPVPVAEAPRPTTEIEIINAPVGGRPGPPVREPAVSSVAPAPAPVPAPAPNPAPDPPAEVPAAEPTLERRHANTELLASIVAGITVPASELEVKPPAPAPVPVPAPAKPEPEKSEPVVTRLVPVRTPPVEAAAKPAPAKAPPAKPAPKVEDTKKPAAAKKPEPAKPKPEAARWWVQVAGGACAGDLDKDWKRVAAGSAALKGKAAYTTPLKATNRLLTGPFKTETEARAVVNALAKEGKSAFTFQSSAGQKVDRLDAK